jgi:predicted regulator of Ras-like GTPase activity (Roadblock/LC7/MglB family)
MTSLSDGASRTLGLGGLDQVIVEMRRGYLFIARVSGGSAIGVIAARDADLGLVGYEITLLVQRFGAALTPALIAELQGTLSLT